MVTAEQIIQLAKRNGIESRLWTKLNMIRIYASCERKDMTIFLECRGSVNDIKDAKLRVYCSTIQHRNWIDTQIRLMEVRYAPLLWAYHDAKTLTKLMKKK